MNPPHSPMSEIIHATVRLYQEALAATVQSFTRCWLITIAVVMFAALMVLVTSVAASLGMLGGFLLGAVNALLIGATLSLIEEAVRRPRRLLFQDIWASFGQYFWDVIGVLFVLWIPVMILERGMAGNPNGPFVTSAVLLLLFILLNPAPEVMYQVRHDTPLDVMKESYEFILENWIEWFLPLVLVLAPLGLTFFVGLSSRLGRAAGLNFFEFLLLPAEVLITWLRYLGLPGQAGWILVILLTPPIAVLMLLFRGHLFAALHGSSRRQRLFKARSLRDD